MGMLEENIVHDSLYKPPLTLSGPGEVEPEFKAMGLC